MKIGKVELGKGFLISFLVTVAVGICALFTIGVIATLGAAILTMVCICLWMGAQGVVATAKKSGSVALETEKREKLRVIKGGNRVE